MSAIKLCMVLIVTLVLTAEQSLAKRIIGGKGRPPSTKDVKPPSKGRPPSTKDLKPPMPCASGDPCDAAYCPRYPNIHCRPALQDPCKAEFVYRRGKNFVVVEDCGTKCSEACPRIYLPVCGTDGQTYGNHCSLNAAKCLSEGKIRVLKEGECDE